MLDVKFVTSNLEQVQSRLSSRGPQYQLGDIAALNERRKAAQTEAEELRARRNQVSEEIGRLKRDKKDATALTEEMRAVGDRIKELEQQLDAVMAEVESLLSGIPNLPHESVPVGSDESANVVVKTWGTPRSFNFEPKAHWDIGEALGILDFERATKITGTRFSVLKGPGAALERAIISFFLDLHTSKHGYTEILPPLMVNRDSAFGTGQLPKFEEDLFKTQAPEFYLIPTAEVPVTNLHRDEILEFETLPVKYCAYTPCFRSEAGSYGKDTRGLIRQHQFNKVELVKFASPETSYDELEGLTRDAEECLELLGLPYRRIVLCTGDMGFSAAKTYDLEVWLPSQGRFREISSCSNFEDYQARRMKARYRKPTDKKPALVHTLNGSGLAVGRTWLAILENYQQEDGSVVIPEVLRPYLGGRERISLP